MIRHHQRHLRASRPTAEQPLYRPEGGPTQAQEALAHLLRFAGPLSVAEVAKRRGVGLRWVRTELRALEHKGYVLGRNTDGRYYIVRRPGEGRVCPSCGALLRRGNPGPFCTPCDDARFARRSQTNPLDTGDLCRRILRLLVAADGEYVNIYQTLGLDSAYCSRSVANAMTKLRNHGCHLEYKRNIGWRILGFTEDGCEVEGELALLLGGTVVDTTEEEVDKDGEVVAHH